MFPLNPHGLLFSILNFSRYFSSIQSLVVVCFILSTYGTLNAQGSDKIEFSRDVRPILANYCFECHGPDESSRKGHLRLDRFLAATESVIVPHHPEKSLMLERMLTTDKGDRMPPPESSRQPNAEHIEILRQWISEGAHYDEHWAFRPIVRPDWPEVQDYGWGRNGLDAFVMGHLEEQGMKPRQDAPTGVLARRLSLALTGLPVLPEQLAVFEAQFSKNPDQAVEQWVDELLASEAYGEHFAWTWLDAARYADTNGYQGDGPRVMWPWRDWLVSALNANLPFDQLTESMLAGDLLADEFLGDWESGDWIRNQEATDLLTATGFLRNHRYDSGSGTIALEAKFENATDRLETVSTVWLGLTMQCARCHSHKFDPVLQREYYQLLAFFDKVPEVGEALKQASHPYIRTPTMEQRSQLERLTRVREQTLEDIEQAENSMKKQQRLWEKDWLSSNHDSTTPKVQRGLMYRYAIDSLNFDGETSVKLDNQPVSLCKGNETWTLSFWFRPEDLQNQAIFSSVEEPERYRFGIQAEWVNRKVRILHVSRWLNSYIAFESVKPLELKQWYHVSIRCDGRLQGLAYKATLNGHEEEMVCIHAVANNSAERAGKAPLILGASPFQASFRGHLRDLRFYDRELSASEITSLADPRSIHSLMLIPEERRTAAEQATLRLAFLESGSMKPETSRLFERLIEIEKNLKDLLQTVPTTMVMKESNKVPTRIHGRGAYDQLGEAVQPITPKLLPPMSADAPSNRLGFARWLMKPEHPLTARVAVNRIWQNLWGTGFVDSPENFGTQCAEPIQMKLLDWLASEYIRLGWDTKALIKLIVTSRTYRQLSSSTAELWDADPGNRHLARGPRFRLPLHVIRDQAMYMSGRLDSSVGGPPVVLDEVLGKDGKPVKLDHERHDQRRTLYTFWKRNAPHPMLAVFDVADRNQCDVRVRRTNTPLQALVTLNEPGLAECARVLGERARAAAVTEGQQLDWIWRACTGRLPSAKQIDKLAKALNHYAQLTPDKPQQAWTALANTLLNLDATLTLE